MGIGYASTDARIWGLTDISTMRGRLYSPASYDSMGNRVTATLDDSLVRSDEWSISDVVANSQIN